MDSRVFKNKQKGQDQICIIIFTVYIKQKRLRQKVNTVQIIEESNGQIYKTISTPFSVIQY